MPNSKILDKFDRLVMGTKNVLRFERHKEEPPNQEFERARTLHPWVKDDCCESSFMPWLDEAIDEANRTAHQSIRSTPDSTYALGFEAGLKYVKRSFLTWAGKAPKADNP